MAYNIYQNDELIAEEIEEKEYTVEGLKPNTEYSFGVSEVIGDKESDKATIKVKTDPVSVTGVEISPKTVTLEEGKTQQLSATVSPSNATDKSVTYASKAQGIASVDEDGLVTAKVAGTAEIVVTTNDGDKKDICTVTVEKPVVNVTGVELSPKNMTGTAGEAANRQLTATVSPSDATNKKVSYSISPEADGLSVDDSDVLKWTADVEAGEYEVTVTTDDGNKTATSTLTLNEPEPEPDPEPDPEEPDPEEPEE